MKLSIIIPVWNQEKLVIKALDSIPKRKDIEIIVIDDGSTDNTWVNLLNYIKEQEEKNIVLLYNKENKGVGYTVNRGYDVATGEYIVLLGSDDYFIDGLGEIIDKELTGEDLIYFDLEDNNKNIFHLSPDNKKILCGSVKFMKKDFIGETRCPEKRSREDYDFFIELLKKNPTEKYLNRVVKHYNFPRVGSLMYLSNKGEL